MSEINVEVTEETPIELNITGSSPIELSITESSPIDLTITDAAPFELQIVEETPLTLQIVAQGEAGEDGVGVPAGGTTGQVLAKNSNTDYDTEWVNQSGGGGFSIGDPVTGGTPNRILYVDENGDAGDSRLISEELDLFGGLIPNQMIGATNVTDVSLIFADASGVGGGQSFNVGFADSTNSGFGLFNRDTFATYLSGTQAPDNTFFLGINPNGTGAGEWPFLVSIGGLKVSMQQDMDSHKIINLTDPDDAQDAATKAYVDAIDTGVLSIGAGNNIDVDNTDPANPVVSVETLTLADISDITASATEVNYTDGVTSSIQTQLDGKVDDTGDTMTGILTMSSTSIDMVRANNTGTTTQINFFTGASPQWRVGTRVSGSEDLHFHISGVGPALILQKSTAYTEVTNGLVVGNLTADTVPYANSTKRLVSSNVTPTELSYLIGVTSGIQNQFSGKVDLSIVQNKGDLLVGTNTSVVDNLPVGSNDQVLTAASGETMGVKWSTLQLMTRLVATPPSGGYLVPPFVTGNATGTLGTTTSGTASSIFLCPIAVGESTTIDALAIEITTAATDAGAVIELALGTISGNTWTRLFSAGTADATTTGTKVISTSQTIAPGVYYAAIKLVTTTTAGTNPQFRLSSVTGYGYGASNSIDTNAIFSRITAGGFASSASIASANYTVASSAATSVPRIGLRKA